MTRSILRFTALLIAFVCGFTSLHAQSALASLRPVAQNNRIAANPDLGPQTQLTGHLPRWVRNGASVASRSVDLSANMNITIVVQRDPAVQAAFEKFLADQQTPGNPLYHQWLTPQQVGTLFGPTASDLAAVTNWLTAQGLTIDQVSNSQVLIDAHGPAAVVANAFRTSFAYYPLNGTPRLSATSEPYVPTALTPVIQSISGLTDIPLNPLSHISAPHQAALPQGTSSNPQPQLSLTSGSHFVTPNDFATIFDINSVYTGGNTGATIGSKAQHVAIIGRSYVATSDITEYIANVASSFNINNLVAITPPGSTAPGPVCTFANQSTCSTSGDQGEQTLDVDRVIGTAPGAYVDLVVSTSINADIAYNVNTLLDPVMTISYGLCELQSNSASYNTVNSYFSQGAAEGISTFVSSGDSGANGCAGDGTATTTTNTASMNYLCSSSYVTCVGGTEYNDTASPGTYWLSANGTGYESAISYIPEGGWNEPSGSCATSGTYCPLASGGGASIFNTTKPTWQTGTGVPNDGVRDTPDVAYPAAGHDGYYACMDYALSKSTENCTSSGGGYFFDFYGTSAAAPSMAGVAVLLNTKLGVAQGNLNPLLYKLAATTSNNVFHDTTVATSGVSGCSITVPSMCNNSTPGSSADSTTVAGGLQGFLLTTGYDEVTGWGSIDVANFLTAALAATSSFTITPASTAYTLVSGATTGNTDLITFTSVGNFAGTVNYTCAVTNVSGTAAGSCSLLPTSGTLAANGTTTSTLTITTTPGTSGVLNVKVTGTSGSTVVTSSAIAVNLTASSFTLTPNPSTLTLAAGATTGNTSQITVTSVNGFAGTVTIGCTTAVVSGTPSGTCAALPTTVTLTAGGTGTTTVTLTSTAGAGGVLTENISGSGTTTGASIAATASTAVTATLTVPTFTLAASPATLNLTSGATTGNTSVVTFTSVNGFAGSVAVSCVATKLTGTAAGSCTATTPITLAANGTATSTITFTSTAGTSGTMSLAVTGTSGSTTASLATPIAVTLTTPGFTLTPATASIAVISGATTNNTVPITVTSTNSLAGTVTLTCVATNASGTAAGSCVASPVTLTANGTATSTVTVTTTPGTSGTLSLAIGGTSGSVTATAPTPVVTATLTAPSFTLTGGSAISVVAGATSGTSTVALASPNLFAGTVSFTCTATNTSGTAAGTCSVPSTALTAGGTANATVTLTTTLGTSGGLTLTITGTGTTAGATISTSATTTIAATVAAPSFSLSTPAALTIPTSGATTGNTTSTTLTSSGFAGTVSFTCAAAATSGSPAYPATCAASSATLTSGGTATSTITVTSTTAQAEKTLAQAGLTGWGLKGGAVLAVMLCFVPFRRRRFVRPLAALALLAFGLAALSGCSSSSTPVKKSSDGTYTVTVTGTGTSTGTTTPYTATTTFTLTISN